MWDGDGVEAPLHLHLEAARMLNIMALEASVRSMALEGWSTPKYFQGQPVWEVDPKIAALDAETIALCGYYDPPYKHTPDGARIQAVDTVKPSPELQVKVLEQLKTYRTPKDVNLNVSGGLMRLDRPEEQTKTVEHKQELPFVGDNDTEQQEQATNFLALGRPAQNSAEFEQWAQQGEFDPKPVTFRTLDGKGTERIASLEPKETDSPLQADLKQRARDALARGPGPSVAPGAHGQRIIPRVEVGRPDDPEVHDGGASPADLVHRLREAPQPSQPQRPPMKAPPANDPSTLPGHTIDGRPTIARGVKIV